MTSVTRKPAYFRRATSTILPFPLTTTHHERLENSLQDLLETVLQCYVNSWYPSISPRDKTFLPHLYQLLIDLLRSISTRIVARTGEGAFDELVLVEIPGILSSHLTNWRRAQGDVNYQTEDHNRTFETLATRFSALYGHDAVRKRSGGTPEALEPATNTLQEGTTNILPNDVDRSLDEAMSSSLHNDVSTKYLHPPAGVSTPRPSPVRPMTTHSLAGSLSVDDQYSVSPDYLSTLCDRLMKHHLAPSDYGSPTERAIVTEILASAVLSNTIEKLSKGWMLTKIALAVLGDSEGKDSLATTARDERRAKQTPKGLSELLFDGYHAIVLMVYQVASLLLMISRWYTATSVQWKTVSETAPDEQVHLATTKRWTEGVPNARDPSLQLLSAALDVDSTSKDRRHSIREMLTWVEMASGPLGLGKYADKLLPLYLHEHVFTPVVMIRISTLLQDTLFPNGEIAPPAADPSEDEVTEMNLRLVARLTDAIPSHLRLLIFGADPATQSVAVERLISPFRDSNTNMHLVVRLVEAVLLTIDPRLAKGD